VPKLPPKKDVLLALLEQSSARVHLDPRPADVRVPSWFKKQPQLILEIGLNLPVPIRDLEVTDEGVSCTLSFNRTPHFCLVPWSAVYALVGENGRGMVWPDDIPPEVTVSQQQKKGSTGAAAHPGRSMPASASQALASKERAKAKSGRPGLRAVAGGAQAAEATRVAEGIQAAEGMQVAEGMQAAQAIQAAPEIRAATQEMSAAVVEQNAEEQGVLPQQKAARPSYLRIVK